MLASWAVFSDGPVEMLLGLKNTVRYTTVNGQVPTPTALKAIVK